MRHLCCVMRLIYIRSDWERESKNVALDGILRPNAVNYLYEINERKNCNAVTVNSLCKSFFVFMQ